MSGPGSPHPAARAVAERRKASALETASAPISAHAVRSCWRCGKAVSQAAPSCPRCQAPHRRHSDRGAALARTNAPLLPQVMVLFGVMLLTSVLFGMLTSFGVQTEEATRAAAERSLRLMVGFELVDAVLVGVGLWVIGRPPRWPALETGLPAALLWMLAIVGIAMVVGVNGSYHRVLLTYLRATPTRDAIVAATGITPVVIFAYCLQPAVIEELFFRYLALDGLRSVMGVHMAVGISSLMFGLAHIGVPLSIPMLALVGVPLAYARVYSGRLLLPMLLHFLHNAIILITG